MRGTKGSFGANVTDSLFVPDGDHNWSARFTSVGLRLVTLPVPWA
jgi:hypothetical protein